MSEREPQVGDKYIATDNNAAAIAMNLPRVPMPTLTVYVSHVYPDYRKVRVGENGRWWLTWDELDAYFRLQPNGQAVSPP